jgi:hypothetical protein
MSCNKNCDQGKSCDCRPPNTPMFEAIAVSAFSLLAALGGFSLFMMCVGYVWEKAT